MKASSNTSTLQGLLIAVLLPRLDQAGHLILGELDLSAAEGRKAYISDLEFMGGGTHFEESENQKRVMAIGSWRGDWFRIDEEGESEVRKMRGEERGRQKKKVERAVS